MELEKRAQLQPRARVSTGVHAAKKIASEDLKFTADETGESS